MWNWLKNMSYRGAVDGVPVDVIDPAAEAETMTLTTQTADITALQLWDVLLGGGDEGLGHVYKTRTYTRNNAVDLTVLNRACTLISMITGQMLTDGSYRIVDDNGRIATDSKAEALRLLFSTSLDGYDPASYTIEDAMMDYLLDGNLLFAAVKERGNVKYLHRLQPWNAQIIERNSNGFEYLVESAINTDGRQMQINASNIVHGRWPRLRRTGYNTNSRQFFAAAPILLMRPSFQAGRALDQYVLKWAERAPFQSLLANFKEDDDGVLITDEQRDEIKAHIAREQAKERGYTILQDGTMQDITAKIDPNMIALKKEQRKEVGILYGLPGPVLGDEVSSWGQGIAELGRLAKTYGFALHIKQFCDAIAFKCLEPGTHIEVDYHKLVQADPAGIKNIIEALRGDGQRAPLATTRELRRLANLSEDYEGELICNPAPNGTITEDETDDVANSSGNDTDGEDEMRDTAVFEDENQPMSSNELLDWVRESD